MPPTDVAPADRLTLVDIVRLDMRRYGVRLVRAEFAASTLLAAALALVVHAGITRHSPMAPVGRLILLGLVVLFAGWSLDGLPFLVIACRHDGGSTAPDDPGLTHQGILRLARLLLVPGSLLLLALHQRPRGAAPPSAAAEHGTLGLAARRRAIAGSNARARPCRATRT